MTIDTNKQITANNIINEFILKFRLSDWNIHITVMSDFDYNKKHGKSFGYDTNGCTEIDDDKQIAKIYIKESLDGSQFMSTIVHEMVHLVTHRYDQHIRTIINTYTPTTKRKELLHDSMWEMEILVSKFTTIVNMMISEYERVTDSE